MTERMTLFLWNRSNSGRHSMFMSGITDTNIILTGSVKTCIRIIGGKHD